MTYKQIIKRALRYLFTGISLCFRTKAELKGIPHRILLSNLAHLGDVVIATSVLPLLKKAFPEARIGFLIGSWSRVVLEDHPFVDYLHMADHWKLNRAPIPLWKKILCYMVTGARALREIKKIHYDVAIDLFYYFPNAAALFWRAQIPVRIGYEIGGFAPLLTHLFVWKDKDQHVSSYYEDLLGCLGICQTRPETWNLDHAKAPGSDDRKGSKSKLMAGSGIKEELFFDSCLPPVSAAVKASVESKIPPLFLDKGFIIFHMGSGHHLKEWPLKNWKELLERFSQECIVFTGQGDKEYRDIEEVLGAPSPLRKNFCNLLTWKEWMHVIALSKLIITVDSVSAHLAGCLKRPTITLYCGISRISHWKPHNPYGIALTKPVACAPCLNKRGCASMACLRELEPETVFKAARSRF